MFVFDPLTFYLRHSPNITIKQVTYKLKREKDKTIKKTENFNKVKVQVEEVENGNVRLLKRKMIVRMEYYE